MRFDVLIFLKGCQFICSVSLSSVHALSFKPAAFCFDCEIYT